MFSRIYGPKQVGYNTLPFYYCVTNRVNTTAQSRNDALSCWIRVAHLSYPFTFAQFIVTSEDGVRKQILLELHQLAVHIVLFEPEIPPNTGSVARLCAATLTPLHLIEPLGFKIDDKHLKRAGLDYWEFVDLRVHGCWDEFLSSARPGKMLFFSKRAVRSYTSVRYGENDFLVFGPETRGLPQDLLEANPDTALRIPMMGSGVRSLNLSNAVSIVLYEALRQLGKT